MRRQNSKSTQDTNKSSFKTQKPSLSFKKPAFFLYSNHSKEFRETIFFSRNIIITSHTYSDSTDQQPLHVQFKANLSEVQFKFLGDKKGFFYLESVFLYQVYLLNYQNCFYISKGLYSSPSRMTA